MDLTGLAEAVELATQVSEIWILDEVANFLLTSPHQEHHVLRYHHDLGRLLEGEGLTWPKVPEAH